MNLPPALSINGKMFHNVKASYFPSFKVFSTKTNPPTSNQNGPSSDENNVLTGQAQQLVVDLTMVVVSRQYSINAKTMKEFFGEIVKEIKYIKGNLSRYDIVGNNYLDPHPLKDDTREYRGTGTVIE